jgi:hypothetical protein
MGGWEDTVHGVGHSLAFRTGKGIHWEYSWSPVTSYFRMRRSLLSITMYVYDSRNQGLSSSE